MFKGLFFQKTIFFDLFEKHAQITLHAAETLKAFLPSHDLSTIKKIKALEHAADVVTRQCIETLHTTFITPIDRDQIYALITRLDDVIDNIDAASDSLVIYQITSTTPDFSALTDCLVEAIKALLKALQELRYLKHTAVIRKACQEVRLLEEKADAAFLQAIGRLFQEEEDAKQIIKWKDLYDNLECASDRCVDVTDVIEGILLEND